MSKFKSPRPTEAELAILRVLWRRGPSTVRQVWEQIAAAQRTGYTTVLKIMQIMANKGLVQRDEAQRSHIYKTRLTEEQTQRQVVGHLLDKVFSGSASKLVMQALAAKKATPGELEQIRKLLDQMEGGQK
jgi:BlaI family transcriptional regulator, penicillinase repressor